MPSAPSSVLETSSSSSTSASISIYRSAPVRLQVADDMSGLNQAKIVAVQTPTKNMKGFPCLGRLWETPVGLWPGQWKLAQLNEKLWLLHQN